MPLQAAAVAVTPLGAHPSLTDAPPPVVPDWEQTAGSFIKPAFPLAFGAPAAVFSSLEWEVLVRHEFDTVTKARAIVIDWCYGLYNTQRRHSAAAGLSPMSYETAGLNRGAA